MHLLLVFPVNIYYMSNLKLFNLIMWAVVKPLLNLWIESILLLEFVYHIGDVYLTFVFLWLLCWSDQRYISFVKIRNTYIVYLFWGHSSVPSWEILWVPLTLGGAAQVSNLFIYIIISNFIYLEDKHKLYIFRLFFMWFFSPLNGLWQLLQLAFQRFLISVMVFELASIVINLVLE